MMWGRLIAPFPRALGSHQELSGAELSQASIPQSRFDFRDHPEGWRPGKDVRRGERWFQV